MLLQVCARNRSRQRYLYSGTYYDTHEEVGDDASDGHHQAFNNSDTCIKAQYKEEIVFKARVETDHEVANSSRDKRDHDEKWHCRYRVTYHKRSNTIVAIQPLSLKYL